MIRKLVASGCPRREVLAVHTPCSQVLSSSSDPCAAVSCGPHGTCFQGACECDAASGYTGPSCATPPTPVDAVYGPWSEYSVCSLSCGGGLQTSTRTCTAPLYGGVPCDPAQLERLRGCNSEPCLVVVNGGWSAWTEWGPCSARCPGDKAGYVALGCSCCCCCRCRCCSSCACSY
jgi:hypothetical protein